MVRGASFAPLGDVPPTVRAQGTGRGRGRNGASSPAARANNCAIWVLVRVARMTTGACVAAATARKPTTRALRSPWRPPPKASHAFGLMAAAMRVRTRRARSMNGAGIGFANPWL